MKGMSSWITIADWMLDLGLDARELMVFALVYGVCSHNERYYGAREHTAKWARCTADTAGRVLNSLTEKGFLLKREEMTHGTIKRCYYRINMKRLEEGNGPGGPGAGGGPPPGAGDTPEEPPAADGEISATDAKTAPDDRENRARHGRENR
jgi:hypothetical protein